MPNPPRNLPHLYLRNNGKSERYRSRGRGVTPPPPHRNRQEHADKLKQAIDEAIVKANQQLNTREPDIAVGEPGFYLEFQIQADKANIFENLANKPKKIELVSVKPSLKSSSEQESFVQATVFVPETAKEFFLKKIEQYRDEETKTGKPQNEPLIARVETLQIGTVQSLFTDEPSLFPESGQAIWWEVWLRSEHSESFKEISRRLNLQLKPQQLSFPEREVLLVMANEQQIERILKNCDAIAELRKAKDTPSIFLEMPSIEQEEWVKELQERVLPPQDNAVSVCLLDTGVNWRHRLIEPALDTANLHTCDLNWGTHDHRGHGTQMAGLILYSDLSHALQTTDWITLLHRLESVKILPPDSYSDNNPLFYGAITEQAVSLPEIQNPRRKRIFCMAITSSNDFPNRGLPSSWSAAIDQLCFNFGEDNFRRLIIISAGNIRRDFYADDYPDINDVELIEDPGQAWNALIVGAYTEKINIIHPSFQGWQPVAPCGDLSPRSRTSVSWDNQWPIRPDVVFEGGNLASDGQNPAQNIDDLSLLTTHHRPEIRAFNVMADTSCATALASYMAARILSEKPKYWPETIRALMVHSAEWTTQMLAHLPKKTTQTQKRSLLRRYGYGVPSLERALKSANNDLTLIIEDQVKPFVLEGSEIKLGEMNIHDLPWPTEKLQELGGEEVKLKVTLSYFIEPNPGERGWGQKHSYASYGLKFDMKRPEDINEKAFRARINKAARDAKQQGSTRTEDRGWFLGANLRKQGSIHSDVWTGSAVDLAARGMLGICPVGGWWKEKKERCDQVARYSLIVTIQVPEVDVDIYTPVSNLIPTEIETEIEV
ncbi:MAG: S8 family peptidase [Snowella sp.]|nr:S8 family peptidase [Snowella sp.]